MGIESGGNSLGDREPAKEAAIETGTNSIGRICIKMERPQTEGTFECDSTGKCPVLAFTDRVAGESTLETVFFFGNECAVECFGSAVLAVIPSPEA